MALKKRKNQHAVALGKKGGKKGGVVRAARLTREELSAIGREGAKARNAKLSPAKRRAIAKKAAQARWSGKRKQTRSR